MGSPQSPSSGLVSLLKLVRWPNLCLLAVLQIASGIRLTHTPVRMLLLIVTMTILATAAGYVINDLYDKEADQVNRHGRVIIDQSMSSALALRLYWVLLIAGLIPALALTLYAHPAYLPLYALVCGLLYAYARHLKGQPVTGNILVSTCCALAIFITDSALNWTGAEDALKGLTAFAFAVTWVREIVKDMEDVRGDVLAGYRTLPIVSGIPVSRTLALVILSIAISAFGFWSWTRGAADWVRLIPEGITLVGLCLCGLKLLRAQEPMDFHGPSQYLKLLMLTGTLSFVL